MFSDYTEDKLTSSGWDPSSIISDNDDSTHLWSELNGACPDAEIVLAVPDVTGGTYEFFTDAVFSGDDEGIRAEDAIIAPVGDAPVLDYVEENTAAIGFIGFPFYSTSTGKVAAPINGVLPTLESISEGIYSFLGRQIYMNLRMTGALKETVPFMVHGYEEPTTSGYVGLSEDQLKEMNKRLKDLDKITKKNKKKKKNNKRKRKNGKM